jgi:hypothetical protein
MGRYFSTAACTRVGAHAFALFSPHLIDALPDSHPEVAGLPRFNDVIEKRRETENPHGPRPTRPARTKQGGGAVLLPATHAIFFRHAFENFPQI